MTAFLVYGPRLDASTSGFALSQAISFSGMILVSCPTLCITIHTLTSLSGGEPLVYQVPCKTDIDDMIQGALGERTGGARQFGRGEAYSRRASMAKSRIQRIEDYLVIAQEPAASPEEQPPAAWPTSGEIILEKLSATYSQSGPIVLDKLDVHIASGEKVGIVGRTGSGKSTLALAILRMLPTTGSVIIDGRKTENMNLNALRSNVTIIPQDPVRPKIYVVRLLTMFRSFFPEVFASIS